MMFEQGNNRHKRTSFLFLSWKRCVRYLFVLILIMLLSFDGTSFAFIQNIEQAKDPEIFYLGAEPVEHGTKFTYRVDSGSFAFRYWEISGCTFDIDDIGEVSESFVYLDGKLRFIKKITQDELRDVWFILKKNNDEFSIEQLTIQLVGDDSERTVYVFGPVCLPADESKVTSFFTTQNIITVGVSVLGFYLLIVFYKK